MDEDGDFAWEWPTGAKKGWSSAAISYPQVHAEVYWCRLDGCAYGLEFKGIPIRKGWTVLTSCRSLWLSLQKRCPGHPEHGECRGEAAQASAYYPPLMVKAVTKAVQVHWCSMEEKSSCSLASDVEHYLLGIEETAIEEENGRREEEPVIMALTRNRFPKEPPTGKKLELIRQQMLRVHRAAGHASFSNLQKLLRARKAPSWAIELAGKMECLACREAKQAQSAPVASLKELPGVFEVLGMDVFEYEADVKLKVKFLSMRDRASDLVAVEHLRDYGGDEQRRSWEPNSSDIIACVCRWLMVNPTPKWILTDSATYFTSTAMLEFCGSSGIGVLTTPAEAHEMLGAEESCTKILKEAARRLLKDEPELPVSDAFKLAAHGHNQTVGQSGFSPFQWTRGSSSPHENLYPLVLIQSLRLMAC